MSGEAVYEGKGGYEPGYQAVVLSLSPTKNFPQAFTEAKQRFEAIDRRGKAAGIMLVILLLGYRMSRIDLIIAGFVVCVYARSQLPSEVCMAWGHSGTGEHRLTA